MENFPGNETCLPLKFCFQVCFFKADPTHQEWLLEPLQWLWSGPCSVWLSISGQFGHLFGKSWSHKLCWRDSNRTSTSSPGWVCHILSIPAAWRVTYFLQSPLCLHRKTENSLKGTTLSWSSQLHVWWESYCVGFLKTYKMAQVLLSHMPQPTPPPLYHTIICTLEWKARLFLQRTFPTIFVGGHSIQHT